MEATHCPVCGFGPFTEPYPSYHDLGFSCDICPCCFCEYGFDDSFLYQENWIAEGGPWHHESLKPPNWDIREQIEHAVEGWRGIVCGFGRVREYENRYGPGLDSYLDWLGGSNPKRRLSAVIILGWLEDNRVEPALEAVLDDPDEDIRRLVRQALDGRQEYRRRGLR